MATSADGDDHGEEDIESRTSGGEESSGSSSSSDAEGAKSDIGSSDDCAESGGGDDSDGETCRDESKNDDPPVAQWMSGKWGIGWRVYAGDNRHLKRLNVTKIVDEIKSIPGVTYVLFNLSAGAHGQSYTAPHSVLSKVNPGSCPRRDAFGELATAFQEAGFNVICYMATEGPSQLKHGAEGDERIKRWNAWVEKKYGAKDVDTLKKAYAEVIVDEFATRYGDKIDGWWFNHASFGNIPLIRDVVRKANPQAIVAFNKGGTGGPIRNCNPPHEDYTHGHPPPVRGGPVSSPRSLPMVTSIEASREGYLYAKGKPSLGHMFMPMNERWNSGPNVVWTEDQAVDWMSRVLGSGGAWTWNIPYNDQKSRLGGVSVEFAKVVGSRIEEALASCAEQV